MQDNCSSKHLQYKSYIFAQMLIQSTMDKKFSSLLTLMMLEAAS